MLSGGGLLVNKMVRSWFAAAVAAAAFTVIAPGATAQQAPPSGPVVHLWPKGVPGGTTVTGPEMDTTKPSDRVVSGRPVIRISNVSDPTLTVYRASGDNSPAIVVFPGGSYRVLAMDLEGTEVCDWLHSIHVVCVLVKYRVPSPEGHRYDAPLQDAQRSLGLVRLHAKEWGIDPARVGVLGFSAGAHMAANLSNNYSTLTYPAQDEADQQSCKPDFAVILYPGYLTGGPPDFPFAKELGVTAQTPSTFILQAEDDPVHVENSVYYFLALKKAGVPAEMHLFAKGGHGYGLRPSPNPVTGWPKLVEQWLHTINALPSPK